MLLDISSVAAATALAATFVASRLYGRRIRVLVERQEERLTHTVHELRTPLTSVMTVFALLRGGQATGTDRGEFLDEGELAARHLAFLVDDMLDGAALAAGRLSLAIGEHAVADVAGDAVRLLGAVARHRGITLSAGGVPGDLAVHADPRRLLQVLFNLVGNALKFSPPGSTVAIDAAPCGDAARVRVTDAGPGVAATLRERLFTPFGREHHGGPAGTGLGLHVTKGLVEHMGGRIGYQQAPGGGSVFWFELPLAHVASPAVAAR